MSLAAMLAGCVGGSPGEESTDGTPGEESSDGTPEEESRGCPQTDDDPEDRFLKEGETPESAGAQEFLATVKEVADEMYRFKGSRDSYRIGFSDAGVVWEIKYIGNPHTGDDQFREEIAALATAFVSNRPDGVSLEATSAHVECTVGYWQVCADTAAAYESGDLDRATFVDRVHERAEIVNNC